MLLGSQGYIALICGSRFNCLPVPVVHVPVKDVTLCRGARRMFCPPPHFWHIFLNVFGIFTVKQGKSTFKTS